METPCEREPATQRKTGDGWLETKDDLHENNDGTSTTDWEDKQNEGTATERNDNCSVDGMKAATGRAKRTSRRMNSKQIKELLGQLDSLIKEHACETQDDDIEETLDVQGEDKELHEAITETLHRIGRVVGKITADNRRRTDTGGIGESRPIDRADVLEERYLEDLSKLSERFRQQKIDLIRILQSEKSELKKTMRLERKVSIDEMELSHERKLNEERQIWQNIVKEYQKEIDVMRYELNNIQRNSNSAIEELRYDYEQKMLDMHAGQQQERKQWRHVVTDKMITKMVRTQFGLRQASS